MPEWSPEDKEYMALALKLASFGKGFSSPNPAVGAVIVNSGRVVGIGYHKRKGLPHAEVLAIEDAKGHTYGSTIYVTLEPHQFHGTVPPCTEAILDAGIKRVVVASLDPNPKVRGKGVKALKDRALQVEVGLMEKEVRELNAPYFKAMEKGEAFVTLKLAVTLDGFIADVEGNSKWITCEASRREVHRLRGEVDGIIVGVGTVKKDNPRLTPRMVYPAKVPQKIVYDPLLETPENSELFKEAGCIFLTTERADERRMNRFLEEGHKVWVLGADKIDLKAFLRKCVNEEMYHILCEGGAGLSSALLKNRLIDRLILMYSPKVIGSGVSPFKEIHPLRLKDALGFKPVHLERVDEDVVIHLEPITKEEY